MRAVLGTEAGQRPLALRGMGMIGPAKDKGRAFWSHDMDQTGPI
jgi:hypothetical protein